MLYFEPFLCSIYGEGYLLIFDAFNEETGLPCKIDQSQLIGWAWTVMLLALNLSNQNGVAQRNHEQGLLDDSLLLVLIKFLTHKVYMGPLFTIRAVFAIPGIFFKISRNLSENHLVLRQGSSFISKNIRNLTQVFIQVSRIHLAELARSGVPEPFISN